MPIDSWSWKHSVALFAFVAAVYLPSIGKGFVYDDGVLVVQPPAPQSLSDALQLFVTPYHEAGSVHYYRPLTQFSYLAQKGLVGLSAPSFHFVNALIAGLLAIAAGALLRLPVWGLSPWRAAWGAAFFVLHPMASSVIYPISGRETLLMSLFLVLTLYAWLAQHVWLSAVWLLAALLCKEPALCGLPLVIATDWLGLTRIPPRDLRGALLRYGPHLAAVVIWVTMRSLLFGGGGLASGEARSFLWAWVYAVQVLLAPFLSLVYEPLQAGWFSVPHLIVAALAGGVLFFMLQRDNSQQRPTVLFWLVWFVLTFLPTSNLAHQETLFDERYVFPSSLALAALLAIGSRQIAGRSSAIAGTVLLVVVGAIGFHRGSYFSEEPFFRQWISHRPSYSPAHLGLAQVLDREGRADEALEAYRRAAQVAPGFATAQLKLASAYAVRGRWTESVEAYLQALKLASPTPVVLYRFGIVLREAGRFDDSAAVLRQSIALEPDAPEPHLELAATLDLLGKPNDARAERERAQQLKVPSSPPSTAPEAR